MTEGKKKQGFASMSAERRREIAAMGGATAHSLGKAHRWTPEAAREAAAKSHAVRYGKTPQGVQMPAPEPPTKE